MTHDIPHRKHRLAMMRRLFFGAILCLAGVSHFAKAEALTVPNPAEFRDGDWWEAYDAAASQKLHGNVFEAASSKRTMHGNREALPMPSIDEMISQQTEPAQRDFTDLAGASPTSC